jgi:adenylate cyclase
VDTPPEADGVRRWAPLVVRVGDQVYPSFALRCLMAYWRAEPEDVVVKLGDAVEINAPLARRRIPIDAAGRYQINFRHRSKDFMLYGYHQAFAALQGRYEGRKDTGPLPQISGRIVLIGQVAEGLTDFGPTPFSPLTALMLVHANMIDNILNEDYTRRVPAGWVWAGGWVLGVVGLGLFSERRLRAQMAFSVGIPIAYLAASTLAWVSGSWVMPWVGPLLGFGLVQLFMVARRLVLERRAKEQIKGMFGSYVPPQVVARMIESREMPKLGGLEEDITAYFSDIQDFSTFAEILSPERLVELMNEYLTACTDIIHEEGGTLDKYIGDAVVAMFGAPVRLPGHAFHACVATFRIQQRLVELRHKWNREGAKWPGLVGRMQSRVGLNTGRVVVGNMGSRMRFNYTMMGDNVNLAARMESGAKAWGVYSMCTEATRLACDAHDQDRVVFRPLGRIRVRGRTIAVPVFEIIGPRETLNARTAECIDWFAKGLALHYERDWEGALRMFEKSRPLEPNIPGVTPGVTSNPSLVYLERVAQYLVEPPPRSWDGVYDMKEK